MNVRWRHPRTPGEAFTKAAGGFLGFVAFVVFHYGIFDAPLIPTSAFGVLYPLLWFGSAAYGVTCLRLGLRMRAASNAAARPAAPPTHEVHP